MKYPVGIQNFEDLRKAGYCYVDKTALVYRLVEDENITFWAGPDASEKVCSFPHSTGRFTRSA